MSESYVECMVAQKTSGAMVFLKYCLFVICALALLLGLGGAPIMLLVAIVAGVGAYFVMQYTNIEYEYLYLDKEITIDKIMNQAKRKKVATYDIDKLEIMAPIKSYHLDGYKNRTFKEADYSSKIEQQPDRRYVLIYNGQERIILEPNEEFVKIVRSVAPRKVFVD